MTEWTMNTAQLEKGMLIRRPGLDESLEVVNVRNGQAKIKLPDGKTSTIPASAEVEWNRPTSKPQPQSKPITTPENEPEPIHIRDVVEASGWQTDWSLLDVGSKIEVLGEPGDFTILRLSDSNARIKHNATGQIQPLSIGHKFKILKGTESAKPSKGKATKGKTKASNKPAPVTEPEPADLPFEEPETVIDDNEPSDEVLTAIENGDDENEIEDEFLIIGDPASLDDLDDLEDDDSDDNDTEDDEMPATSAPKKSQRSTSPSLLTVGQISERTGISYPTLMRYIRDHGSRLPSEGEGRARRFLPESIEVFRQIRSETKGGRPSSGKTANPRKAKPAPAANRPTRPERSHETAAPYAAPARAQAKTVAQASVNPRSQSAPSSTIDQALVSAIEHAQAQMAGLQSLIDNLEAQREALKLWS